MGMKKCATSQDLSLELAQSKQSSLERDNELLKLLAEQNEKQKQELEAILRSLVNQQETKAAEHKAQEIKLNNWLEKLYNMSKSSMLKLDQACVVLQPLHLAASAFQSVHTETGSEALIQTLCSAAVALGTKSEQLEKAIVSALGSGYKDLQQQLDVAVGRHHNLQVEFQSYEGMMQSYGNQQLSCATKLQAYEKECL